MDSLNEHPWDVLIAGTGLQQSLLALALSRSGKRVLHVDQNDCYGGPDAAFSLQEAESWVRAVNAGGTGLGAFLDASLSIPDSSRATLSFSRAYTLSLSPQIIYTRSDILPRLVSSKVYRQLEFQAVGNWWVYREEGNASQDTTGSSGGESNNRRASLKRVPNGREDVFADKSIDHRAKGALMKFLRFVGNYEEQSDLWDQWSARPFPEFLTAYFHLPNDLQAPLLALTLSPLPPSQTLTSFALPRIKRHLTSIGVFGPGFAAVIPKWGGGAEIAQVACRACAVGGGVYVLSRGVESVSPSTASSGADTEQDHLDVSLGDGETVQASYVVGSHDDLPQSPAPNPSASAARSITVVSSSLQSLFPVTAEGAPTPGAAVVVFPTGSLSHSSVPDDGGGDQPPVYIIAHSSDTGECPDGQCLLYASTSPLSLSPETGYPLLDAAVAALLRALDPAATVLWSMRYTQRTHDCPSEPRAGDGRVWVFPPPSLDLVFDDGMLARVERAWRAVDGVGEFLRFEDRGGDGDGVEDED